MKHIKTFEWYQHQRMNSGTVKYIDSSVKYDWNYSPEIKPKEKVEDEEDEEEDEEVKEGIIGKYHKKIEIDYLYFKTQHAELRQHRGEKYISDGEIKELTNRSIERITNALIFDEIDIGDKVHLKDSKSELNIVIGLEEKDNDILVKIITVMRVKDFKTDRNTKTIII